MTYAKNKPTKQERKLIKLNRKQRKNRHNFDDLAIGQFNNV